jgi:hypothetical protein
MRMRGQLPTAEIVDSHNLLCRPVREVIVHYLEERRPALDYSTFYTQAHVLAAFWADLEAHNPGIDSLHLSDDVAEAWRQRIRTVVNRNGTIRRRRSSLNLFVPIRAFYLDLAAWALENPSWAPWAVPCPVRRGDTEGYMKNKREVTARMHQRVRDRLPHLLRLVDSTEGHLHAQSTLLAAAQCVHADEQFDHAGVRYRRLPLGIDETGLRRTRQEPVRVEVIATGEQVDLSFNEDEAFWSWAIIETLRLTGVRLEELLELTQLALVSHRLPETNEVIPLLQIVPSKTNQERLLVVTPELASARQLGLANTTFRRRFPHIVAELAAPTSDRQPSSSRPARTSYDQLNDDNARLREHKRELAEHHEFAVAQLQRLTLDNHQLREQLETERQITRLPRSSANLRHTKGSTHS